MTDHATSVASRLQEAGSPRLQTRWEKNDGYYVARCRVSSEDVPQLIKIASKWADPDWPDEEFDHGANSEDIELLPVTAWRALADLKSAESVEPLIGMLCECDEYDDWSIGDLPHVFGKIGRPSIGPLAELITDADLLEFVRSIAVEGLRWVAEYYPETRDEVVEHLTRQMKLAAHNDIEFNSTVLVALVDLQAAEAAEPIEIAFSNDQLDVGMIGDWEYVRQQLGVEGLHLKMPEHPHNSIADFRRRMGIGIFSEKRIFGEDERDPEAEEAYLNRAESLFSKSEEAQQVVEAYGELRWVRMFLQLGTQELAEIVDEMSVYSVEEFVLDHVPRKVSTEAESAGSIILELTKFWEYVQRVYNLPAAGLIIEWLKADGLVDRLKSKLADPANFGMAKSVVMAGMSAGYDMTTQEGMNEFIKVYNRGLLGQGQPFSWATGSSSQQRVGRNDPCPCGSGKKFKKCCLNRG